MMILGVSALYHDSAAAILRDGEIIAAAQEERFSRKKHDARIPVNAIRYCLQAAGLKRGDRLDAIAFYDKPITKFTRLLTTFCDTAPSGFKSFLMGVPAWVQEKGWVGYSIEKIIRREGIRTGEVYFPEHHASHAASAFYPSPYEEAAVLTADGVGEWTC
jgi:carbamoyltransferase